MFGSTSFDIAQCTYLHKEQDRLNPIFIPLSGLDLIAFSSSDILYSISTWFPFSSGANGSITGTRKGQTKHNGRELWLKIYEEERVPLATLHDFKSLDPDKFFPTMYGNTDTVCHPLRHWAITEMRKGAYVLETSTCFPFLNWEIIWAWKERTSY